MNIVNIDSIQVDDIHYFNLIRTKALSSNLALKKICRLYHNSLTPYFLPIFPISSFEIIDNETFLDYPHLFILDGAYGLSIFFNKYPDGDLFRTTLLINPSLYKLVPASWREKVYFYEIKNNLGLSSNSSKDIGYFHQVEFNYNQFDISQLQNKKNNRILNQLASNEDIIQNNIDKNNLKSQVEFFGTKTLLSDNEAKGSKVHIMNSSLFIGFPSSFFSHLNQQMYLREPVAPGQNFNLVQDSPISLNLNLLIYKINSYNNVEIDWPRIQSEINQDIEMIMRGDGEYSLNNKISSFLVENALL